MYFSEKEATQKICHRSMGLKDTRNCETDDCMAWQWKTTSLSGSFDPDTEIYTPGAIVKKDVGHCRDLNRE